MATQRKRQKKGDVQGEFKCRVANCNKVYLSYPALYTHIKNKHGDEYIGDIERPPTQGSRGRPKREDIQIITHEQVQAPIQLRIQIEAKQSIDDFLLELVEMDCKSVLQQETDVIKNSQVLNCVGEVFRVIEDLYKGNLNESQFLEKFTECLENSEQKFNITDGETLVNVSCDEAISFFLKELSYTVSLKFLQNIAYYLLSFRHCLLVNFQFSINDSPKQFGEYMNQFMRDCNNYFSEQYLEQFYTSIKDDNKLFLKAQIGVELLRKVGFHFCNWLFSSRYTSQKLQLC